jgi:hypothetical protein
MWSRRSYPIHTVRLMKGREQSWQQTRQKLWRFVAAPTECRLHELVNTTACRCRWGHVLSMLPYRGGGGDLWQYSSFLRPWVRSIVFSYKPRTFPCLRYHQLCSIAIIAWKLRVVATCIQKTLISYIDWTTAYSNWGFSLLPRRMPGKRPKIGHDCVPSNSYPITLHLSSNLNRRYEFYPVEIAQNSIISELRGCIQKFSDWPPGARATNGKALCH